ncbi:hypothetical protein BGZ72_011155 [Mortierella alpina]|nr:hypothetical protein BGZ72_011155 [Mortierella alpina]
MAFTLLSDTFSANEMGEQMGKAMVGQTMGLMLGPPLGGVLDEKIGRKAPFAFCLIFIGLDLGARLLIIEPRTAKIKQIRAFNKQQEQVQQQQQQQQQQQHRLQTQQKLMTTTLSNSCDNDGEEKNNIAAAVASTDLNNTFVKQDKTSVWKLLKHPRLATALLVAFAQGFNIAALEPVLPLYLEREFGLSKTQIGLVFLALSIPTLTAPLAGAFSDKHGAKWMACVCAILCAVVTCAIGIPGIPLWAIIVCLVVLGSMSAAYLTPVMGEITAVVRVTGEGDGFGRALGLFNASMSLAMVVAPLLGAVMYEKTSMIWTTVAIGAITLAQVPVIALFVADKRQKLLDQQRYEEAMNEQERILELARISKEINM